NLTAPGDPAVLIPQGGSIQQSASVVTPFAGGPGTVATDATGIKGVSQVFRYVVGGLIYPGTPRIRARIPWALGTPSAGTPFGRLQATLTWAGVSLGTVNCGIRDLAAGGPYVELVSWTVGALAPLNPGDLIDLTVAFEVTTASGTPGT